MLEWRSSVSSRGRRELDRIRREQSRQQQQHHKHNVSLPLPSDDDKRRRILAALKACSDIEIGKQIHGEAVASRHERDAAVSSALVTMYAKCGSLRDACDVFHTIPHSRRDVVAWTALMLAYADNGAEELALRVLAAMINSGAAAPDAQSFVVAIKACTKLAAKDPMLALERGMAVHSRAARSGFELHLYVGSSLVDMYSRCGRMEDAARVFDRMPARNVVSWTALILGYAHNGQGRKSLELLERMLASRCLPNSQTIVAALKACSSLACSEEPRYIQLADGGGVAALLKSASLERGFAIHSQLVAQLAGFDAFVGNTLIDLYAKCGSMGDARRLFDAMGDRATVVSWNALMLGCVHNGDTAAALELFSRMRDHRLVQPDAHTLVILLNACGSAGAVELGRATHSAACRRGLLELKHSPVISNALVDFYAKCGSLGQAQALLDSCAARDVVTWSALLDGYARAGELDRVFASLRQMRDEELQPSGITFLSLLTACSHAGLVDRCAALLASMPRASRELEHYHVVIDALGRANQLREAAALAETIPLAADAVTWLTLLSASRKWNNVAMASRAFQKLVAIDGSGAHAASAYVLMANSHTSDICPN